MRAPPPARRGAHRDEHHCSARGSECDVTDDDDWKINLEISRKA